MRVATRTRASIEPHTARGLRFAVHRWRPLDGPEDPRLVLLMHGFQDSGGTFADVAEALAARGFSVAAPDQRGFGRTSWVSPDAYYHFPEYLADLDALLDAMGEDGARPLALVGHSMGGTVAALYAGARPERAASLALVEGIGPPDMPAELALERTRSWLDGLRALREHERFATFEDALARFARHHHDVPKEALARALPHLIEDAPGGGLRWRFDPRHRTRSPTPFSAASFTAFLARIACPVLWISGGPRGFHPPDEEARLARLASVSRREIDGGHMLHWTRAGELSAALLEHLGSNA